MPIELLKNHFECIVGYLEEDRINGYATLGTVLIDGQLEQTKRVRDFISAHS